MYKMVSFRGAATLADFLRSEFGGVLRYKSVLAKIGCPCSGQAGQMCPGTLKAFDALAQAPENSTKQKMAGIGLLNAITKRVGFISQADRPEIRFFLGEISRLSSDATAKTKIDTAIGMLAN